MHDILTDTHQMDLLRSPGLSGYLLKPKNTPSYSLPLSNQGIVTKSVSVNLESKPQVPFISTLDINSCTHKYLLNLISDTFIPTHNRLLQVLHDKHCEIGYKLYLYVALYLRRMLKQKKGYEIRFDLLISLIRTFRTRYEQTHQCQPKPAQSNINNSNHHPVILISNANEIETMRRTQCIFK